MNTNHQCPKCGREYGMDVQYCRVCGVPFDTGPVPIGPRPTTVPAGSNVPAIRKPNYSAQNQEWDLVEEAVPVQNIRQAMRGNSFLYGVVLIRDNAEVLLPLTDVRNIEDINYSAPNGNTNIAGGLALAGKMLTDAGATERYVILGTDGEANRGGGFCGNHKEAGIAEAKKLWELRTKVAAIGIQGGTSSYDAQLLKQIVSNDNLFAEANAGFMVQTFARMTRTATQNTSKQKTRGLVLVLDASGSMSEGSKWQEAMQVVAMIVDQLKKL